MSPIRRLAGFDYRDCGTYFVTICTRNRERLFGRIQNHTMECNDNGRIAMDCIERIADHFPGVTIDASVVMPDHLHVLLHIGDIQPRGGRRMACHAPNETTVEGATRSFGKPQSRSLSTIVGAFKSAVTKRIRESCGYDGAVWQRNFHEHIVRDSDECERIKRYIRNNPANWRDDELHS